MGPDHPLSAAWHVALIDDVGTLRAWGAAWNELAQRTRPAQPTRSYTWVRAQLEHLDEDGIHWAVAFVSRGARLVGVLPLVTTPAARGTARWLPVLRTLADDHTPLAGPLIGDVEHGREVLQLLVAAHLRRRPRPASILFEGMVAWHPAGELLRAGLPPYRVQRFADVAEGSTVDARVPFQEHVAALSRNARSQWRRAGRRLAHQGRLAFSIEEDARDFAARYEEFQALEASGWKGRAGTAIAVVPRDTAFFHSLLGSLASAGHLRWHVLRLDGRAIAMEIGIRFAARLVIYKVAYDEALRGHSPGHLVWARALEAACADPSIRTIDLLTYDSLARRWNATPYPYDRFLLHRPGWIPTLFAHAPAALKARLRALRERWRARRAASASAPPA